MKINSFLIVVLICIVSFSSVASAQTDSNTVDVIDKISAKKSVTFQDVITLFGIVLKNEKASHAVILNNLRIAGISKGLEVTPDTTVRKGMLALLIAQYCKLHDCLFFKIFKTERYAFRACVAHNLMDYDGSEWDPLSGEELIEIFSKVMNYTEKDDFKDFSKYMQEETKK